jgi:hypothetical protein
VLCCCIILLHIPFLIMCQSMRTNIYPGTYDYFSRLNRVHTCHDENVAVAAFSPEQSHQLEWVYLGCLCISPLEPAHAWTDTMKFGLCVGAVPKPQ